MKSVRVQFVLTETEYEQLKTKVEDSGVSISKYIKDRVLPQEESFETIWAEFVSKLETYPSEMEFSVVDVMTEKRWAELDKPAKLSLGRLFNKKVKAGEQAFDGIDIVRRSSSNVSLYMKRVQ